MWCIYLMNVLCSPEDTILSVYEGRYIWHLVSNLHTNNPYFVLKNGNANIIHIHTSFFIFALKTTERYNYMIHTNTTDARHQWQELMVPDDGFWCTNQTCGSLRSRDVFVYSADIYGNQLIVMLSDEWHVSLVKVNRKWLENNHALCKCIALCSVAICWLGCVVYII